jgi:hypothetical protein
MPPAAEENVVKSRFPKRGPGLAAGKTLWGYMSARIDQICDRFGDVNFVVSALD